MLDPKLLRQEPEVVAENLAKRGFKLDIEAVKAIDQARKALQVETQELQAKRNALSKQIGQKKSKGEDASDIMIEVGMLGDKLIAGEAKLDLILKQEQDLFYRLPNTIHHSVPDGRDESENHQIRTWGDIPEFNFTPKDHVELGENLGGLDFDLGVKLSGARFTVMRGAIARLHRALGQFMLDTHTQFHGYEEAYVPYLVEASTLYGSGQLPKMHDDLFHIQVSSDDPDKSNDKIADKTAEKSSGRQLSLIPTAEVPLTNFVQDVMQRAPRARGERLLSWGLIARAYLFLGVLGAAAEVGVFFFGLGSGCSTGSGKAGCQSRCIPMTCNEFVGRIACCALIGIRHHLY